MKKIAVAIAVLVLGLVVMVGSACSNNRNALRNSSFDALEAGEFDTVAEMISDNTWLINSRRHGFVAELFPAITESNRTLFIEACWKGNHDLIQKMVEYGAEINSKDRLTGLTPLLAVLSSNSPCRFDIAKEFIESGAKIDAKSIRGDALFYSVMVYENDDSIAASEFLKFLLDNAKAKDIEFNYAAALVNAAVYNNKEAIRILCELGVDPDSNETGKTALMYAAERNYEELAVILLDYGADKQRKDADNNTAYDYAFMHQYTSLMNLLGEE